VGFVGSNFHRPAGSSTKLYVSMQRECYECGGDQVAMVAAGSPEPGIPTQTVSGQYSAMVLLTRSLVLRTVDGFEQQADGARLARDYKGAATLRFLAVRFREWLAYTHES
jgi:hypothetical protein